MKLLETSSCVNTKAAWSLTIIAGLTFLAFTGALAFWWTRICHLRRSHMEALRRRHPYRQQRPAPHAYPLSQLAIALGMMSLALSIVASVTWWQHNHQKSCTSLNEKADVDHRLNDEGELVGF